MIVRRGTAPIRLITRGSLLSLCLLAFVACDTRSAWATCGDYLHGHGSPVANRPDMQTAMPMTQGDDHASMPGRKCTGPQCQQNRQKPGAPTKTVEVPVSSDAILMAIAAVTNLDDFSSCQTADAEPITGVVGDILRPPQAI